MRPELLTSAPVIGSPTDHEWQVFLLWAEREGWRVPSRELALYRHELADSAFVLCDGDAGPLGFVTVCRQQRSAWIGNLLVDPNRRGRGIGRRLFTHAVGYLSARGTDTLWLTASAAGRPLYAAYGFREVERIERWVWREEGSAPAGTAVAGNSELYPLVRADAGAWGYSRAGLLTLLARGGQIFTAGSTVALLQPGDGLRVLGPWLSADSCPRANRIVIGRAVESLAGSGVEVAADVIGRSPVRLQLRAAGFRQTGETVLMMRGEAGKVQLGEVVALASLGSMG